jgi:hypothetical protein
MGAAAVKKINRRQPNWLVRPLVKLTEEHKKKVLMEKISVEFGIIPLPFKILKCPS